MPNITLINGQPWVYGENEIATLTEVGWVVRNKDTEEVTFSEAKYFAEETLRTFYKCKKKLEEKIDLSKTKIGSLYKYKALNDYVGMTGKYYCRADTTNVGVEIELEKVNLKNNLCGTWLYTEDGSLKDNGAEFVSVPIQFKYLELELDRLFSSLKKSKATSRCSVHVHLNVRDMTIQELLSFIALYVIFEKSFYNFSGGRWNNNFCVPLYFYPSLVKKFVVNTTNNGEIYEKWYKYFGFNLSPIFGGESKKIGTVEFRHMCGNTDTAYIITWINLIVSLKVSAKQIPFKDIMEKLKLMNTDSSYGTFSEEIFRDFSHLLTEQETFKQDVESCIAKAKSIFFEEEVGMKEVTSLQGLA